MIMYDLIWMQNSDFTPSVYDFNVFSVKINSLKLTKA